jgi:hypothetical protein
VVMMTMANDVFRAPSKRRQRRHIGLVRRSSRLQLSGLDRRNRRHPIPLGGVAGELRENVFAFADDGHVRVQLAKRCTRRRRGMGPTTTRNPGTSANARSVSCGTRSSGGAQRQNR